jgi:hypothetical protein
LSPQPDNQKPKTAAVRFARGETKVPNLFQDLTGRLRTQVSRIFARARHYE